MTREAPPLSVEDLALETAEALPDREAMSLIAPDPPICCYPEPVVCPLPPEVDTV